MTLSQKTLQYWELSVLFYRGIGRSITTGEALNGCNALTKELGPQRTLRTKVIHLNHRIIQGKGRKRKSAPPNNILEFQARA